MIKIYLSHSSLYNSIKSVLTLKCLTRISFNKHAYKARLKLNQLYKTRFMKVNELKLTKVELF